MELCEEHGDRPITIRTLTEIAEREGWSLDTRLSVEDVETEEKFFARGVSIMPGGSATKTGPLTSTSCMRTSGSWCRKGRHNSRLVAL